MLSPDSGPRRDLLLGVLAVCLLTAPLWLTAVPLNESGYEYDRAEVVVNGSGVEYVDRPGTEPISEDIACTGLSRTFRACAFERYLSQADLTVPTGRYTGTLGSSDGGSEFRYVQVDSTLYRPASVVNTSARLDGRELYRIELTLEPVAPERALEGVTRGIDEVPSIVADAARGDEPTTRQRVDIPADPVAVGDRYYRVYLSGSTSPMFWEGPLEAFLVWVGPVVALVGLARLSERIEVSYVGETG